MVFEESIESVLDRFEAAWRSGEPPLSPRAFVDGVAPERLGDLFVQLVAIDLEFRWKAAGGKDRNGNAVARRPVEEYLREFPGEIPADLRRWAIVAEYRVRTLYGDRPPRDEYARRFPADYAELCPPFDNVDLARPQLDQPPQPDASGANSDRSASAEVSTLATVAPAAPVAPAASAMPARPTGPSAGSSLPARIGRYRIDRLLGQGGFGAVYLGFDENLDRPVAIKVPLRERLPQRPEELERFIERFLQEAKFVASLRHPHIVEVHDADRTADGLCYVTSRYLSGGDLARRIREARPGLRQAVEIVAKMAEALHCAHTHRDARTREVRGIVHRDVKPANILLDERGEPYLSDFGLAVRDEDLARLVERAGTPHYMSPEQVRGEGHRVDGRSDLFSLGVVFYELLTGRRPFHSDSWERLFEQINDAQPRPPRLVDDEIPRELDRICLKLLARRASDRYSTARDLADDLRHWKTAESAAAPAAPNDAASAATPQSPASSAPVAVGSATSPTPLTPTPVVADSDSRPVRVVPKGLRSFDAHDADFFLDLLPGPRDRDGLPDSLRFWKTRLEQTDPDETFAVGLIYGPSGCGKSSLMKAGLLPRLSSDVISVDVEATADETETRLLNGLRKRCPALDTGLSLTESLAMLRRGQGVPPGKKVVLVLDQFEQWLHAKKDEEHTALVQALRHCDGGRVQCVVMVRDDFWMAVTRFLRELEVRLVEGHNSGAVDLFPVRHAEKVLVAFGRAFGALPEGPAELLPDARQFVEQAVQGLSQEGKVICVRLALFAEMMKGRAWTPASLKAVGGTEGVGVTFLEETFSASTAPPEHRYHQKAARAVLRAMLPESASPSTQAPKAIVRSASKDESDATAAPGIAARSASKGASGADIKGHMRSRQELLHASGYGQRPRDFNDLLAILDHELRLITPTDPEGKERDTDGDFAVGRVSDPSVQQSAAYVPQPSVQKPSSLDDPRHRMPDGSETRPTRPSVPPSSPPDNPRHRSPDGSETRPTHPAPTRYYQLTHDYLVPSLRDWLTRKQRETRRGRAELLLVERAAAWNAKPLNRNLPAWHEDVRIRALTNKSARTESQHRMMKASGLYHATRWGLALMLLCVLGFVGQRYESNRRAEIARQTHENNEKRAESLVDSLLTAPADAVPFAIENLKPLRELALPVLQQRLADKSTPQAQRMHAAMGLAAFGQSAFDQAETSFLVDGIATAADAECRNVVTALSGSAARDAAQPLLQERFKAADVTKDATTRARLAIVALHLGDAKAAIDLSRIAEDPMQRRIFEETLATWNGGLKELAKQTQKADDGPLRAAVCLGLGRMKPDSVPEEERQAATQFLLASYQHAPDTGTHGAADWALRQWNVERPALADATQPSDERNWYVNSVGMTMLKLPAGKFRMGSEDYEDAKPVDVTLTRAFFMADSEVSVGQFQQFIDDPKAPAVEKPDKWEGADQTISPTAAHPVQQVSWYDAVFYCNWLSRREGRTPCYERTGKKEKFGDREYDAWRRKPDADGYCLPTEAEWEYACRAGTTTDFSCGDDEDVLRRYAVFHASSTALCGSRLPTGWGLFDVHGNVWEWCQDWFDYSLPGGDDPDVSAQASNRVLRGGCWIFYGGSCRSAARRRFEPAYRGNCQGFRVAARLSQ